MYEINPKFLNEDGSINYRAACDAGRLERSKTARRGLRLIWSGASAVLRIGQRQATGSGCVASSGLS